MGPGSTWGPEAPCLKAGPRRSEEGVDRMGDSHPHFQAHLLVLAARPRGPLSSLSQQSVVAAGSLWGLAAELARCRPSGSSRPGQVWVWSALTAQFLGPCRPPLPLLRVVAWPGLGSMGATAKMWPVNWRPLGPRGFQSGPPSGRDRMGPVCVPGDKGCFSARRRSRTHLASSPAISPGLASLSPTWTCGEWTLGLRLGFPASHL